MKSRVMTLARNTAGGKHSSNGSSPSEDPTSEHSHEILKRRSGHYDGQRLQDDNERANKKHESLLDDDGLGISIHRSGGFSFGSIS
jgi:hypothetical protein